MKQMFLAIATFHISFLMAIFGVAFRKSTPNGIFGIRTKHTMASFENWTYVHNKASIPTVILGILGMAVSILSYWVDVLRTDIALISVLALQIASLIRFAFVKRPSQ